MVRSWFLVCRFGVGKWVGWTRLGTIQGVTGMGQAL
jgi:hypothetical protein